MCLTKACPTLSGNQALVSFYLVKRFLAARGIEKSHIWYSMCIPELRWLCAFETNKYCCISFVTLPLFLDFQLLSMQQEMQHQHLGKCWWCNQCINVLFTQARTLHSTPGPSRPHTIHISWYNKGIPRMWTDFGKTSLYSLESTAD